MVRGSSQVLHTEPLRRDIVAAIRDRTFGLVYQPIVDLCTGMHLGVEALTRPPDGHVPDVWFARCHDLGLAPAMDLAIIARALEDLDDIPAGYLSLNVSVPTLSATAELIAMLRPAVARRTIVLELSERVIVRDYEALCTQLDPIRDAGMLLAVDDAGAGYASFQHIVRLGPEVLKLDRSFISSIDTDAAKRAFAMAAAVMARELGVCVVAEGVETAAEAATLRAVGITAAQGYHLGRPQPLPLPPVVYEPDDLVVPAARPRAAGGRAGQDAAVRVIRDATEHLRRAEVTGSANARLALCQTIDRELHRLELELRRLNVVDAGSPETAG